MMELHEQILCDIIAKEVIPGLKIDSATLVEMKCYQAICQIYDIVSDETLEDSDCFQRVERIVCALEELGIGGGGCHDFG